MSILSIVVPFSILALKKVNCTDLIILTVSLQTIAANVGCMVLPIGAPHNIVMYTVSKIPFDFDFKSKNISYIETIFQKPNFFKNRYIIQLSLWKLIKKSNFS